MAHSAFEGRPLGLRKCVVVVVGIHIITGFYHRNIIVVFLYFQTFTTEQVPQDINTLCQRITTEYYYISTIIAVYHTIYYRTITQVTTELPHNSYHMTTTQVATELSHSSYHMTITHRLPHDYHTSVTTFCSVVMCLWYCPVVIILWYIQ